MKPNSLITQFVMSVYRLPHLLSRSFGPKPGDVLLALIISTDHLYTIVGKAQSPEVYQLCRTHISIAFNIGEAIATNEPDKITKFKGDLDKLDGDLDQFIKSQQHAAKHPNWLGRLRIWPYRKALKDCKHALEAIRAGDLSKLRELKLALYYADAWLRLAKLNSFEYTFLRLFLPLLCIVISPVAGYDFIKAAIYFPNKAFLYSLFAICFTLIGFLILWLSFASRSTLLTAISYRLVEGQTTFFANPPNTSTSANGQRGVLDSTKNIASRVLYALTLAIWPITLIVFALAALILSIPPTLDFLFASPESCCGNTQRLHDYLINSAAGLIYFFVFLFCFFLFFTTLEQARLWLELKGHPRWLPAARRYVIKPAMHLLPFTTLILLSIAILIVSAFPLNLFPILASLPFSMSVPLSLACLSMLFFIVVWLLVGLPYNWGLRHWQVAELLKQFLLEFAVGLTVLLIGYLLSALFHH